jgi:hypothetical protein
LTNWFSKKQEQKKQKKKEKYISGVK